MDCREFLDRYSEYDDSLVPPHEADRFRAHMAECRSCARYDRVLRKGRMIARQIPRPEPSPDFVPRLQRRLLQGRLGPGRTAHRDSIRPPLLAAGLAAATIVMVAASAVRLMEPGQPEAVPVVAAASPAAPSPSPRLRSAVGLPELPAAGPAGRRAWAAEEVAPADTSTYSPLVTGPPVYRRPPSFQGTATDRRALD